MESQRLPLQARPRGAQPACAPASSRRPPRSTISAAFIVIATLLAALLIPSSAAAGPAGPGGAAVAGQPAPPGPAHGSAWATQVIEAPPQFDRLRDRSIALDTAGRPHIVYGGSRLYQAWWDGTQWRRETADPSPGAGYYPSLVIDAQGYEHVSYASANGDLKYTYRDAAGWHAEKVDRYWPGLLFSSLALDSAGRPHIAYCVSLYELGDCLQLRYASWTGAAWNIEILTNPGSDPGVQSGNDASLVLDSGNRPHIVFTERGANQAWLLRYIAWNGSGWQFETVDNQGNFANASLVLGLGGVPNVAYWDRAMKRVKYAIRSTGGWQPMDVAGADFAYVALAIDATGSAQIAITAHGAGILLARWTGSVWSVQVADSGDAGKNAAFVGLAVDAPGHAHISYIVPGQVLYYLRWTGTTSERQAIESFGATPQTNSLAVDRAGRAHVAYWSDPEGVKYAFQNGAGWTREIIEPVRALGISVALDRDGNPAVAYFDVDHYLLRFAYCTGGSWQVETVTGWGVPADGEGLAFDPAGHPGIVFQTSSGDLTFAYKAGNAWTFETIAANGQGSLAFDSAGNPSIAYMRGNTSELVYVERVGGQWRTETVDGARNVPSLVMNAADQPNIAYQDDNGLKYARRAGQEWQRSVISATQSAGPVHIALGAGDNPMISFAEYLGAFEARQRLAENTGQGWAFQTVDTVAGHASYGDLAAGPAGAPYISYVNPFENALRLATRGTGGPPFVTYLPILRR